jgi:ubiquinone/menaquinone biosynthesis C-methylase UbiE
MVVEQKQPKNQITLNPIRRLFGRFESSQEHVKPYVASGQVVADLGCGSSYYTLPLAECVDPEGRVYRVDLNEKAIRTMKKRQINSFTTTSKHTLRLRQTWVS